MSDPFTARAEGDPLVGDRLLALIDPTLCAESGWTARDAALAARAAGIRAFVLRPPRRALAGRGVPPGAAAPAPLEMLAAELRASGAIMVGHAALGWSVALEGLHLPAWMQGDAASGAAQSRNIWSASVHDLAELRRAAALGAERVLASPFARTRTKPGYNAALGAAGLRELVAASTLPVIALGGIQRDNLAEVVEAGAAAVAVMGPVCDRARIGELGEVVSELGRRKWRQSAPW